jgi:hypothetical protein
MAAIPYIFSFLAAEQGRENRFPMRNQHILGYFASAVVGQRPYLPATEEPQTPFADDGQPASDSVATIGFRVAAS